MANEQQLVSTGSTPSVPVTTNFNPLEPAMQGINTAMQLASHQEQLNTQRQTLQLKQDEMKQHAVDGAFDMLSKAKTLKGPAQKVLYPLIQKRFELAGVTIDPSVFQVAQSNDEFGALVGRMNANPELRKDPQFMQQFAQAMESPENLIKYVGPLNEDAAKFERTKLQALAQSQNTQDRLAVQKSISDTTATTQRMGIQAQTDRNNATLMQKNIAAGINPAAATDPEQAQAAAMIISNRKDNEQRMKKQDADTRLYQADLHKADIESNDAYRQGQNALRQQTKTVDQEIKQARLDGIRSRTSNQEKSLYTRNFQQVETSLKPLQNLERRAEKGVVLLDKPKVTMGEFREALVDMSSLLTQTGQSNLAREQGLTQAFTTLADQSNAMIARYITNNPADAVIKPETLALLKADFHRIADTTHNQYAALVSQELEGRRGQGFKDHDVEKLYNVYRVKSPKGSGEATTTSASRPTPAPLSDAAGASVTTPTQAAAQPAQPIQQFSAPQIQAMIQQGGAAKTKAYLKSKGYSDQQLAPFAQALGK